MLSLTQRRRLQTIAIIASSISIVPVLLTARIEAHLSRGVLETNETLHVLPSRGWLVPLSLGYREAAAGLIWTDCLVYFGQQHEVGGRFEFMESYLNGVVDLDPHFYRAYSFGSVAFLYDGTLITRRDVELSIRLLERGLEVFPDDGELHYYLGFQYYFEYVPFLEDVGDEEGIDEARRKGIDELCTGAMLGGGPPFLPLTCSGLATRRGMEDLAIERLQQVLVEEDDPEVRARIEYRLESVMNPDATRRLLQTINERRLRWRREMPYVPFAFYLLAGPVPVFPLEDQLDLPLPMDAMIRAADEELERLQEAEYPAESDGANGDAGVSVDGGDGGGEGNP